VNERLGFIALPNILAGREVVPELRAVLAPADVARHIIGWLDDREGRSAMSRELRQLAGTRGAAARLAAEVTKLRLDATCASGS
jgi:lipid-A-disaccharide synthase